MNVVSAALVLTWICLILLAFALAGLLRQIRDLQADIVELTGQGPHPLPGRRVAEFAGEPAPVVVLVVDPECSLCGPVMDAFAEVAAQTSIVRFEALSFRRSPHWPETAHIRLRIDEQLYRQLDVPWAPALLVADSRGVITGARPVTSPADLRGQLRDWTDTTAVSMSSAVDRDEALT